MDIKIFLKKGFYLFTILAIFLTIFSLCGMLPYGTIAAWIGLLIGYLNFIGGTTAISSAISKPDKQFLGIIFGGMIIRFVLIFAILFILIEILELDKITMIAALFISYLGFLVLEIWQIHQFALSRGNS